MNKSDLPFLSASELSRLIAAKEVSPVEVAESYLERIDSLNGKLRAYVTVTADVALEAAKKAELEAAKQAARDAAAELDKGGEEAGNEAGGESGKEDNGDSQDG